MKKKEACQILNLRIERINDLIKDKKIKTDLTGKILTESVYDYLQELNERRSMNPPTWIHRNEF